MRHTISEVAMRFGVSSTPVLWVYRKYQVTGKNIKPQTAVRRNKTLKERDRRLLSRVLKRYRHAAFSQISANINAGATTIVRVQIVQRTVIYMAFLSRRSTLWMLLTARHKHLLLSWDHQHLHLTVEDWKRIAWFDEFRLQLYRADGSELLWIHPHESI